MQSVTDWQQQLKHLITDPVDLLTRLKLQQHIAPAQHKILRQFPCRVPLPYFQRIQPGNVHDPLLRQVLPLDAEATLTPGYSFDPLAELQANPTAGLLHKYHGRVLLTLTSACAIHCRYCFRRHFPYEKNSFNKQRWQLQRQYLLAHPDIHEVILSGGDPLIIKDPLLKFIVDDLSTMKQIKTLRIHSRLPIVLPSRITSELLITLSNTRLKVVVVVHCNHAQEIDAHVTQALLKLQQHNITLLNQAVLLKGVNDTADSIVELSHQLWDSRVLPYYLHLLDKTQGTAHFNVDKDKAKKIILAARQQLPGYLVPRLAQEEPQEKAKTIVL
jgi:L-lysine 2,3-aminomutase